VTELLYQRDAYLRSFPARVLTTRGSEVVLDRTAFYATSGGQPNDTGQLHELTGRQWAVRDVEHTGGGIVHRLEGDGAAPRPGTLVDGEVDWARRHLHMRGHTALHVLSGVVYHRFQAGTSGGQIGEGQVRMDFRLPQFDKAVAEELVTETNRILASDLPISVRFIDRAAALADPSMVRVAAHLLPDVMDVRLIDIGGYDVQADGGTHVRSTREVGRVRLERIENKGSQNKRLYLSLEPSDGPDALLGPGG
jgi:misacylated tRNA(Ala) deacylase